MTEAEEQITQKIQQSHGIDIIIINATDEGATEPCAVCGADTHRAFRTDQGERFPLCRAHTAQAHDAILGAAKRGASATKGA